MIMQVFKKGVEWWGHRCSMAETNLERSLLTNSGIIGVAKIGRVPRLVLLSRDNQCNRYIPRLSRGMAV